MQARPARRFRSRILILVAAASLVPAALLLGISLYLNGLVQRQMDREVDEALSLAINLEQALIDASLVRMRDRAVALAAHPAVVAALAGGGDPGPILDDFQRALPGADLIAVVGPDGRVVARAGAQASGERLSYGGLVDLVLSSAAPVHSPVVITAEELAGEPAGIQAQVRMPVIETPGSADPRTGQVLDEALALVGAAPVRDEGGRVLGAVLVSDILNNDHAIVDEVLQRSTHGLRVDASIALDGIRVTTTVPAVGGGRRAVGTLYSDVVMERLRSGQEYRGRALVGGWQWQRTIYVPLRDPFGQVIAAPFVGIPEAAFAQLARTTSVSTGVALLFAVLSVAGPILVAHRFADRLRQRDEGLAGLAAEIQGAGDALARDGRKAWTAADDARAAAEEALRATEQAGESTGAARGRMRELEVTLARVNAGTDEQTRTLRHAARIVALVSQAVQESRSSFNAVLEALRAVMAAAQQGRQDVLRAAGALELLRLEAEPAESGEGASRLDRLIDDLEQAGRAVAECDAALEEIVSRIDEATERLWALAAIMNESGARAGAVSQQMADLTQVAEETAERLRATTDATREVISAVEAVAGDISAGVGLVRRARTHVDAAAEAHRRLDQLAERIQELARQLAESATQPPQ
ncbi:cache domain-containing protein [Symbiobacterium thermophilum]|uniref:Methyl-accepting transducer domain-containing protein n=1 Tax=Symbiobacterium thermophilum TaxID=2734 RepID=A0A953IAU6_SYMTR|nr:cache domain-containing protein [Symbiobacterium thermophilum]MBY6274735.1 hypothetical protein [Symbiobacterium thermophilum]